MVRLSKLINKVFTGNSDKTVYASVYQWRLEKASFLSKICLKTIDNCFWFDKQHCRKAYCSWKWGVK